jgi:FkbM family methyltransferase
MRAARKRPIGAVARAPLEPRHYRALVNALRFTQRPWRLLARYLLGRGDYPYVCTLRTPVGSVAVTTHSPDDVVTVVEVFCRLDYPAPPDVRLVLDVGSNIGISALYFLTRNAEVRCMLYEPVPENVERLRRNLAGFEDRYTLYESAVAGEAGTAEFGVEATGRYGGIGVETGRTISVDVRGINDVVAEALGAADAIDILKLDTEGLEVATVRAIRGDLLRRVRRIYLESDTPVDDLHDDLFDRSREGQCERLVARASAR